MGTTDSCVRKPCIPMGERIASHRISQLSEDTDPFLEIVGDPKGLGMNEAISTGLVEGE